MGLLDDPICETYRLPSLCGSFGGSFTLPYPSKSICEIVGLVSLSQLPLIRYRTELQEHVKSKGRSKIIYYTYDGEIEKENVIILK